MLNTLRLETRLMLAGPAVATAVTALILVGVFAIWHGRNVIGRQQAALAASAQVQAREHARVLGPIDPKSIAGDQLYYLAFHTARHPSPWASVAIGLRDVQAFNLKVRLLALQGQLYDADLGNPLLAAFGHFDLAFVLVALMPLFVIALTFNVHSGDVEAGVWNLVRSQPVRSWRILLIRYGLRAGAIAGAALALLGVATIWLDLPLDREWRLVAGVIVAYVLFWTTVAAGVSALRRSSDFNALALLGVWLVWTALGPAMASVAAAQRFPLPEALELTVLQRQGYHGSWDEPLPAVMEAFYRRYPAWRGVPIPRDRYSNGWYYAMQQRGDDAAQSAARGYRLGLEQRDAWLARASWWTPPAACHRILSRVARTDVAAHLRYLDSVATYHESLKRHFFPIIFSDAPVGEVDWSAAPTHRHQD